MIHTLVIIFWTVFASGLFGTLAIIASVLDTQGNMSHGAARLWAKSILAASGIRVTVKGLRNIDPEQSYIYMSNHQSNFDIPVLLAYLPVQFRWLAKAELFKIPLFGYAMKRSGYISIDRSNRKSAFLSLKKAARAIRDGVSVVIFPEGTRSRDGRLKSFKKGGFVLAVDAGVPVVPLLIHGTWQIMPKRRLRIKPGNVVLEILEPIETRGYTRKTKDALLESVNCVMRDSFEGKKGMARC